MDTIRRIRTGSSSATSNSSNQDEQQSLNIKETHSKKQKKMAFKVDRLGNKSRRYVSHNLFLKICLSKNLVPNSLKLELEPLSGIMKKNS